MIARFIKQLVPVGHLLPMAASAAVDPSTTNHQQPRGRAAKILPFPERKRASARAQLRLTQGGRYVRETRFEIRNKHYLAIKQQGGNEVVVDIVALRAEPSRLIEPAHDALRNALAFPTLFLVVATVALALNLAGAVLLGAMALPVALLSGRSALRYRQSLRPQLVFRSRAAGFPLVRMLDERETSPACRKFVATLAARIQVIQQQRPMRRAKLCVGEIRMFRRLHRAGMVDKLDYASVKEQLLREV